MNICSRLIYVLCSLLTISLIVLPINPLIGKTIGSFYMVPDVILVSIIGDYSGELSYISNSYPQRNYSVNGYVEAKQGERYSIKISNTENCRVGLVISVDGLNIITEKKSNNNRHESMYIIRPGETCDYSGWRSSMNHEQRFYFTNTGNSYANRLGYNSQIGIIKVTAFREKNNHHYRSEIYRNKRKPFRSNMKMDTSYSKKMSLKEPDPGTGYGEHHYSKAVNTDFNPEEFPSRIVTMKCKWSNPKFRPTPWKLRHNKRHSFATPPPNY